MARGITKRQQEAVGRDRNILPNSNTGLISSFIFRGHFQTSTGAGKNPRILLFLIKVKNSCCIFTGYLMNERAEQLVHEF